MTELLRRHREDPGRRLLVDTSSAHTHTHSRTPQTHPIRYNETVGDGRVWGNIWGSCHGSIGTDFGQWAGAKEGRTRT
eukprot:8380469-Pyramimonas_sp.AAC.1